MALQRPPDHSGGPEWPATTCQTTAESQALPPARTPAACGQRRQSWGCNVLAGPRPLWPRALPLCRLTDKWGPVRGWAHRGGCGGEACRGEQSEHDESTVPGHARDLRLGALRPVCLPGPASSAKSDCPTRSGHRLIEGGCSQELAEPSPAGPHHIPQCCTGIVSWHPCLRHLLTPKAPLHRLVQKPPVSSIVSLPAALSPQITSSLPREHCGHHSKAHLCNLTSSLVAALRSAARCRPNDKGIASGHPTEQNNTTKPHGQRGRISYNARPAGQRSSFAASWLRDMPWQQDACAQLRSRQRKAQGQQARSRLQHGPPHKLRGS